MDCEKMMKEIKKFLLVYDCDEIKNGMIRVATPFQYPDGSYIDLFLGEREGSLGGYVLTDMGGTADYLFGLQAKPGSTKSICETLKVDRYNSEFRILISKKELVFLPSCLTRLMNACVRIVDRAIPFD